MGPPIAATPAYYWHYFYFCFCLFLCGVSSLLKFLSVCLNFEIFCVIASIDKKVTNELTRVLYCLVFCYFFGLMMVFVAILFLFVLQFLHWYIFCCIIWKIRSKKRNHSNLRCFVCVDDEESVEQFSLHVFLFVSTDDFDLNLID